MTIKNQCALCRSRVSIFDQFCWYCRVLLDGIQLSYIPRTGVDNEKLEIKRSVK